MDILKQLSVKIFNIFLLIVISEFMVEGQEISRINPSFGTIELGVGPSFYGVNTKAGLYLNDKIQLQAYWDSNIFLQTSIERGLALRRFTAINKNLKTYIQPSVSTAIYRNLDFDTTPPYNLNPKLKSLKTSIVLGMDYSFGRKFSFSMEAGYGYYNNLNFGRYIARTSINYRLLKFRK